MAWRFDPTRATAPPALLGLLAGAVATAWASPPVASLPDPTRPPMAIQMATAASGVAARLAAPEAKAKPAAAIDAPLPVLQAVQVPVNGAPTAMIDGRLLKVGETFGEHTLIGIDQQGVVLRSQGRTQRLRLLGDRAKQPVGSIVISRSPAWEPAAASAPPAGASAPVPTSTAAAAATPAATAGQVQTTPLPPRHESPPRAVSTPVPVTLTAKDRP